MQKIGNNCQVVHVRTDTDKSQEEGKGNSENTGCLNTPVSPPKRVSKHPRQLDEQNSDPIAAKLQKTLPEDSPPLKGMKHLRIISSEEAPPDILQAFLTARKHLAPCTKTLFTSNQKGEKPPDHRAPNQNDGIPWHLLSPAERVSLMDRFYPEMPPVSQNNPEGE